MKQVARAYAQAFERSGWADLNRRSPRPKRGALTRLRYTPARCESSQSHVASVENASDGGRRAPTPLLPSCPAATLMACSGLERAVPVRARTEQEKTDRRRPTS